MILKHILFTLILLVCSLTLFSQVKFTYNNVDTVSPLNREIIGFFEEYINHRTKSEDFSDYWYTAEKLKFPMLDTYEKWIYQLYKHSPQTILGLSKPEDDVFKIKVMLESPNEGNKTVLYAIQNFLVRKTEKGFKLQDMLGYQLDKGDYTVVSDMYFDFYLPENMDRRQKPISAINDYVQKIENYFDRKIPVKLRYVYAPSCEDLNRLRGYDYVANMMSTKTNVCGLTDSKNLVMYSSYPGVHKHELLRLLNVMFPKSLPVLMDGFTNLAGGSMGKPISYWLIPICWTTSVRFIILTMRPILISFSMHWLPTILSNYTGKTS
jgi:hypothetical protein